MIRHFALLLLLISSPTWAQTPPGWEADLPDTVIAELSERNINLEKELQEWSVATRELPSNATLELLVPEMTETVRDSHPDRYPLFTIRKALKVQAEFKERGLSERTQAGFLIASTQFALWTLWLEHTQEAQVIASLDRNLTDLLYSEEFARFYLREVQRVLPPRHQLELLTQLLGFLSADLARTISVERHREILTLIDHYRQKISLLPKHLSNRKIRRHYQKGRRLLEKVFAHLSPYTDSARELLAKHLELVEYRETRIALEGEKKINRDACFDATRGISPKQAEQYCDFIFPDVNFAHASFQACVRQHRLLRIGLPRSEGSSKMQPALDEVVFLDCARQASLNDNLNSVLEALAEAETRYDRLRQKYTRRPKEEKCRQRKRRGVSEQVCKLRRNGKLAYRCIEDRQHGLTHCKFNRE